MSKEEKIKLFSVIFFIIFLTALPQIYGFLNTPGSQVYTGNTIRDNNDKFQYMAWMGLAREYDGWNIPNIISPKIEHPVFMPFWKILGLISRWTMTSTSLFFNLSRLALGIIFLLAIYKFFISQVINNLFWRILCLAGVGLSGGFVIFKGDCLFGNNVFTTCAPVDIWHTEANTFTTLLNSPMRIMSQLALIIFFAWMVRRFYSAKWFEVLGISLAVLFLGFIHPYAVPTLYGVSLAWLIFSAGRNKERLTTLGKDILKISIIIAISSLSLYYFVWMAENDPGAHYISRFGMLSPPPLNYILGFGPLFIIFLIALPSAFKNPNDRVRFLAVWGLSIWPLLYLPVFQQRRFVNTLHIAIVILAFWWLENNYGKFYSKHKRIASLIAISYTIIFIAHPLSVLYIEYLGFHHPKNYFISIERRDYDAFMWLKHNTPKNEQILMNSYYLDVFQMYSLRQPFVDYSENIWNFKEKMDKDLARFYDQKFSDKERRAWLKANGIRYIFYTEKDQVAGNLDPEKINYISKVYEKEATKIFEVSI